MVPTVHCLGQGTQGPTKTNQPGLYCRPCLHSQNPKWIPWLKCLFLLFIPSPWTSFYPQHNFHLPKSTPSFVKQFNGCLFQEALSDFPGQGDFQPSLAIYLILTLVSQIILRFSPLQDLQPPPHPRHKSFHSEFSFLGPIWCLKQERQNRIVLGSPDGGRQSTWDRRWF